MATVKHVGGPKPWEARDKRNRQRFRTKAQAEDYKRKLEDDLARERAGLPVARRPKTFNELADEYLGQYNGQPQSKRTLEFNLNRARQVFGRMQVRHIREQDVAAWLNGLDLATATRINTKKALSQVLNAALRWGYLAANPVRDVRLGNTTRPPIRPFESWAEVDAIAKHAGAYGHAITFAAATGFRPQEWLALRWQDLDIPARKATVNQTLKADRIQPGAKNEESERTIRLPSRALQALAGLARPLDRSRLVFLTPEGDPWTDETFRKRIYRPALEASGIAPRGLKELRHTFASLALAAGAQIQDVSRHLGHKDITTTLTYYAKFLPETEERFLATLDSANTSSGGTAVAQEEGRG